MKKAVFILAFSLYSSLAFSYACLEKLVEIPLFQLTSTLVVGPTTLISFKRYSRGSVHLNPRVYLSPFDEEENHLSIGITPQKKLYLVYSKSRRGLRELSTGWLLSGELKVESFGISSFGFLSVIDIEGKIYTINDTFASESLQVLGSRPSMRDALFGKTIPETGLLIETSNNESSPLRRLDTALFLNSVETLAP